MSFTPLQALYLARYKARAAAKLCRHCGRVPQTNGVLCASCRKRNTIRMRALADSRRKLPPTRRCLNCDGLGHKAPGCDLR